MTDPTVLPCGCLLTPCIENGIRTLKVAPCQPFCRNLAALLHEGHKESKRIEHRRAT